MKAGTDPNWMPGEFDQALRKRFVDFVALVVVGLDSGHIKAKPVMPIDPNAESVAMTSVDEIGIQLLRDCGCLEGEAFATKEPGHG